VFKKIKQRLKMEIGLFLNSHGYYYLPDLTVGARCGCCGKWVEKAIVEKGWEWSLCGVCSKI